MMTAGEALDKDNVADLLKNIETQAVEEESNVPPLIARPQ